MEVLIFLFWVSPIVISAAKDDDAAVTLFGVFLSTASIFAIGFVFLKFQIFVEIKWIAWIVIAVSPFLYLITWSVVSPSVKRFLSDLFSYRRHK